MKMISIPRNARIYVAGHRGLVGSAINRLLQKRGCTNILTATRDQLDLRDQAAVNHWFKVHSPEYVFLVAGTVGGIMANYKRPAEFIYDNLMIHATVVHAAYLYGTKKLLYLGSSCIYPRECPQPMKENYLLTGSLEPTNEPYALAKIAGIKLCQAYRRQYGCRFISAMPTNLYGPGDNFDLESSHVLPALLRKFHLAKLASQKDWESLERDERVFGPIPADLKTALGLPSLPKTGKLKNAGMKDWNRKGARPEPQTVTVWGSGTPYREFMHVDDLAAACLFLMDRYDEPGHINIGTGLDLRIRDLAELIREVVFPGAELIYDTRQPDGPPRKLLDVAGLEALGWKPRISFRKGIDQTYRWYLGQTDPRIGRRAAEQLSRD
jgi:GDP-L-fucose synthase